MKRTKRVYKITAVLVLAAGVAVRIFTWSPQNLVQRSTPLVDTSGWLTYEGGGPNPLRPYQWINNTSLFMFESLLPPKSFYLVDLAQHTNTPFTALEKRIAADKAATAPNANVSPDGLRVYWLSEGGTIHTAGIDGASLGTWIIPKTGHGDEVTSVSWLRDGHRWFAECDYRGRYNTPVFRCVGDSAGAHASPKWLSRQESEALEPADDVSIIFHYGTGGAQSAQVDLGNNVRTREIVLPAGLAAWEAAPSLDRRNLAWILVGERQSPFASLIHKIYAKYPVHPIPFRSLWVSRFDGSKMHEIGRVDAGEGITDAPWALRWTPSGTHVSYLYRAELYSIGVKDML